MHNTGKTRLSRQIAAFAGVGVAAAIVHYGLLIALVELFAWRPTPATLIGYIGGGIVSYVLNRRLTYRSDRPHEEATWRFAVVAGVGFALTYGLMEALHGWAGLPYVLAQVMITGLVLVWSFFAHKFWSFGS
jgi:putative flippase GtrA